MNNNLMKAIVELTEAKTIELVQCNLDKGLEPFQILKHLQEGIKKVIEHLEEGEYYIGELIVAGIIFEKVLEMEAIQKFISSRHDHCLGTILLATMEKDSHTIGKDIFKSMALSEGFNVIDLGSNVKKERFLIETQNIQPDIIGISGLNTSAAHPIAELIELFENEGIRDQFKIIIGGNTMLAEACKFIGADVIVHDAEEGLQKCFDWVGK